MPVGFDRQDLFTRVANASLRFAESGYRLSIYIDMGPGFSAALHACT